MPASGRRTPFEKANWTPRALEVLATAKAMASPNPIRPRDLLLAMEAGDTLARRIFKKLSTLPSAVLNQTAPTSLLPDGELFFEDFESDFGWSLPRLAATEARSMGHAFLGTEALLLLLARLGVAGFDLPYDRIREIVPDISGLTSRATE
jgi:hypothetical protein